MKFSLLIITVIIFAHYFCADGATISSPRNSRRNDKSLILSESRENGLSGEQLDPKGRPAGVSELTLVSQERKLKREGTAAISQSSSSSSAQSSGSRQKSKKKDMMSRILPMMVMPFLVSTSMIPMMLTSLKFMLIKSMFLGKVAILLMLLNTLVRSNNRGGVFSHNIEMQGQKELHRMHYGYTGEEEYGVYVNHGRSKKR